MLPGRKNVRIQDAFFAYAVTVGLSNELGVNGSITPVRFQFAFPTTNRDFKIINASLTLSGGKINDPDDFAGISGLLNGMEIGWRTTTIDYPLASSPYKTNNDLISGSGESKPWGFNSVTNDAIQVEFLTEYGVLVDPKQVIGMYVIVKDNLTALTGRFVCRGNKE